MVISHSRDIYKHIFGKCDQIDLNTELRHPNMARYESLVTMATRLSLHFIHTEVDNLRQINTDRKVEERVNMWMKDDIVFDNMTTEMSQLFIEYHYNSPTIVVTQ